MTDGDLEALGGKGGTECLRHGFGVAEITHVFILCLNETKVPGACVTGPLVRAKGYKGRDTFTVPEGRKQQVVSTKVKNGANADWCQSPGSATSAACVRNSKISNRNFRPTHASSAGSPSAFSYRGCPAIMSNSPHRSFARITSDDLARLAQIALDDFADLCQRQEYSRQYTDRLRLICLPRRGSTLRPS